MSVYIYVCVCVSQCESVCAVYMSMCVCVLVHRGDELFVFVSAPFTLSGQRSADCVEETE